LRVSENSSLKELLQFGIVHSINIDVLLRGRHNTSDMLPSRVKERPCFGQYLELLLLKPDRSTQQGVNLGTEALKFARVLETQTFQSGSELTFDPLLTEESKDEKGNSRTATTVGSHAS